MGLCMESFGTKTGVRCSGLNSYLGRFSDLCGIRGFSDPRMYSYRSQNKRGRAFSISHINID